MKRGLMKAIIALITILFANIAIFMFLEEFVKSFWICYAFSMIAAVLATCIEIFYEKKEILIFRYPIMTITYLYLIVQLVVAFALFLFFNEHVLFLFLVQLFIFSSFLVLFLLASLHSETIKEQQKERAKDIINFRYILDEMDCVIAKTSYGEENRKVLQHAYDSLASGQIKSHETVQGIEQEILNLIKLLNDAVDNKENEKVLELCTQLEYAADRRKKILSNTKIF